MFKNIQESIHAQRIKRPIVFVYLYLFWGAILYAIGINVFVRLSLVVPSGLIAIPTSISFLIPEISQYVSPIYLGLNIPLIIFFYFKIRNKSYIYRTIFFLVIQALVGTLFLIDEINTFLLNTAFEGKSFDDVRDERWTILIFGIISGLIVGLGLGISWKMGGSSGGTDLYAYYYSSKYKKSAGYVIRIISLSISFISFILIISIDESFQALWIFVLGGTLAYIYLVTLILDTIYPKYQKVEIIIDTKKEEEIKHMLAIKSFPHITKLINYKNAIGQNRSHITTDMLLLESRYWMRNIVEIDPNARITIKKIKNSFGEFNTG